MTEDVAKSAGIGVARGAIGLAGIPGDVRAVASNATDAIANKFGIDPENVDKFKQAVRMGMTGIPGIGVVAQGPTSKELQERVEGVTGKFYEPQTVGGEYARTAGEFLPAAPLGPGGVARRAAMNVALPAALSETAGQATKGTEYEPYARIAGALAPAGVEAMFAKGARQALPSSQELRAAGSAAYKSPEVQNVILNPASVDNLAASPSMAVSPAAAVNAPKTAALARQLQELPTNSPIMGVHDVKEFRTALNEAAKDSVNPLTGTMTSEGGRATKASKEITSFLKNLQPSDVVRGDARAAAAKISEADQNYGAGMRAATVDRLIKQAENSAGAANSGMNVGNRTRQKLRSLLDSEKKMAGFTDDEAAQLERAVMGTTTGNAARYIGNLLGGGGGMGQALVGGGSLAAGGAAAYASGDPRYMALGLLPVAGAAARSVGNKSATRQADKFSEMVRGRAPASQPAIAANEVARTEAIRQALIRALLSGDVASSPLRIPSPADAR